ncbi:MAG: hypothetical protein KIT84_12070 [Labilithrix sp.]|nr:hypothetical protein [Labilithrix sp.]MCW5811748.1 hypothetical protein [Labilithrix sp.]
MLLVTHRSSHNVLLRGVSHGDVIAAVERRLAQDGYVRVKGATSGVRVSFHRDGEDIMLSLHPSMRDMLRAESASGWLEREWAEHLAEAVDASAVAIGVHEDGPGSHVTRFAADGHQLGFTIEEEATRISAAILGRPGKGVALKGKDGEAFAAALTKGLALPKRWLHVWDPDEGETFVFRRRAEIPVLPKRAKATGFEPAAAAYRGRNYAVGTFAFGAEADLESVANVMSELVRAFAPPDGLRVQVTRGEKSEVLPSRFSRTASIKAAQLARGGSVELTAGHFFHDPMAAPIFWIANDPAVLDEQDAVPLHFGFALTRPGADAPERALAHAMSVIAEVAAGLEGCLSAVVAAQGTPISLADTTLPYETLAGTVAKREDGRWLRAHARSPGWRTLIPRAKMKGLARPPPDGVTLARVPSGVLVQHDAPTPFAVGDTTDVERWLLPAFG